MEEGEFQRGRDSGCHLRGSETQDVSWEENKHLITGKGGELQSGSFVLSGEFLFLYTIDKNQDFLRPGSTYKISQDSSPLDITGACHDGTAKYSVALCLSNCPTKLRSRGSPLGTQHRQLQYRQYNICCFYGLSLPLNGNGWSR